MTRHVLVPNLYYKIDNTRCTYAFNIKIVKFECDLQSSTKNVFHKICIKIVLNDLLILKHKGKLLSYLTLYLCNWL